MRRWTASILLAMVIPAAGAGPAVPDAGAPNVTSTGKGEWTAIHLRYAYAPGLAMLFKNGVTQGQPILQLWLMSPLEQQMLGSIGTGGGGGQGGLGNRGGLGVGGVGGIGGVGGQVQLPAQAQGILP